ncbi:MAG: hypothetical protein U9N87_03460 [Planctomycetota bacterium]|nr:hypothetical protein [Planctomycetota bacterium]
MPAEQGHRKRVRHYDEPGHFHKLTFSSYRRMPLLTNDVWRAMLSASIDRIVKGHGFHLSCVCVHARARPPARLADEAKLWRWSSCRWYIEEGPCRDEALPTVEGCPVEFWADA